MLRLLGPWKVLDLKSRAYRKHSVAVAFLEVCKTQILTRDQIRTVTYGTLPLHPTTLIAITAASWPTHVVSCP